MLRQSSQRPGRAIQRSAPRRAFGVGAALALLLVAGAARAALPGISLDWHDCPGGATSSADLTFDCSSNTAQFPLVGSLLLSAPEMNLIGAELVIDVQHTAATMPDWWRLDGSGSGGCRAGALSTSFDFTGTPGCTDAWLANGFGGIQSFSIGPPDHPALNQARIKVVAAVTSDNAVTMNANVQYGVVITLLSSDHSTGAGICAGCPGRACLVLNSILLRRVPGMGADLFLSTPASAQSNWATWQGSGADCALVPVRRMTWGAIKSLYR